jgi:hypothetical protein
MHGRDSVSNALAACGWSYDEHLYVANGAFDECTLAVTQVKLPHADERIRVPKLTHLIDT